MRVIVPGEPVAKARPRRGRNGNWYTPPATREYEERVAWHVRAAKHSFGKQPLSLSAYFYISGNKKGDGDNYLKAVLDGCEKGGLFDDDKAVVEGRFLMQFQQEIPHTRIVVVPYPYELEGYVYCDGRRVELVADTNNAVCSGCGSRLSYVTVDTSGATLVGSGYEHEHE